MLHLEIPLALEKNLARLPVCSSRSAVKFCLLTRASRNQCPFPRLLTSYEVFFSTLTHRSGALVALASRNYAEELVTLI